MSTISLHWVVKLVPRANYLERASASWLLFALSPSPADESHNNQQLGTEVDERFVFNNAVHVHRPDECQRRNTLHASVRTYLLYLHSVPLPAVAVPGMG